MKGTVRRPHHILTYSSFWSVLQNLVHLVDLSFSTILQVFRQKDQLINEKLISKQVTYFKNKHIAMSHTDIFVNAIRLQV